VRLSRAKTSPEPQAAASRIEHSVLLQRNGASAADSLAHYFSRVVCINLRRRPDRWQRFCEQLEAVDWPFRPPERFRAVDGSICSPPDWIRNRYPECEGAWGCYQSHLRILEDALLDDVKCLLILEDDAVIVPDFRRRVGEFLSHVPDDWDHLFLGGEHRLAPVAVNRQVYRCRQVHRTHAHALRGDFIRQAYEYLISYPTIDHYRRRGMLRLGERLRRILRRPKSLIGTSNADRSAHVDHHFGAMHRLGRFNVFAPRAWLAGQAAGLSDIMQTDIAETFWSPAEGQRRK